MDEVVDAVQVGLGLGLDSRDINAPQMALRAVVVFIVTVLIDRS